ncbi:MAG: potassium-transporting ATPase subunit KdpB [Parachlamydiaceae bacterium]|nr:potassium-transporting ATPase subunit KdpB [Parachlamydiaceae bacterium]
MKKTRTGILDSSMIIESIKDSFIKLDPRFQAKNPVMFITYLGAILSTFFLIFNRYDAANFSFNLQITLWLWFTVLFANFACAIAESRGKAQANSLRQSQTENMARKLINNKEIAIPANQLRKDDLVVCEVQDIIPADGEVIEGVATVDESAITGESAPVIRESGGDRSAVTAGTRIVSDRLVIRVTSDPGDSFLDRMIGLIEGAERQKTPNEVALDILLGSLTLIFILTVISVKVFALYSSKILHEDLSSIITLPVLIALLVCLIPTTISALLSAIGIAGMDRLIQRNVIAKSGRAVEAAGDIDLLILDKTGTITLGNRMATEFIPATDVTERQLAEVAQLSSLADETPEGRSIVVLAKEKFSLRGEQFHPNEAKIIPFSAQTSMSGIDFLDEKQNIVRSIRKGAVGAVKKYIEEVNGIFPAGLDLAVESISKRGGTPLLVTDGKTVLGIVHLKDIIKGGIRERFDEMRNLGIKTLMVTGDNAMTASAIAAEAGVDDYLAQATPEIKLNCIREKQKEGHLIAMTGDGTNDAPALAQADVGVAMNTGTQASREAGNMVDLDSNPTKLIEIVEIGKQLLMTRGALTTFSIANDVAKYFAIIPALFGTLYLLPGETLGPLNVLNIMDLESPQSAVLSAIIFNALIIIALIPLALKGVHYRPQSAEKLLQHNLLVYGLGGLITPFIFIKIIDKTITFLGLIS